MAKEKMHIHKTKSHIKLTMAKIVALICVVGIVISGYRIITWLFDAKNTQEQTGEISKGTNVAELDDSDAETAESDEQEDSPYWRYLKQKLIDVDLNALRQQNSDTKAWLQVTGTNINYPVVQTTNNEYYLKHSFDKSYNSAGWVFADFRNKLDGTDRNTIFYAHARSDGSMFGSLKNILSSSWVSDDNNFTVRTVNDSVSGLWQVFSVYHVPTTSDYIQTDFHSDAEYLEWLNMLKARSSYKFNANMQASDKIITLSTCYGVTNSERVVMHARLIKWLER